MSSQRPVRLNIDDENFFNYTPSTTPVSRGSSDTNTNTNSNSSSDFTQYTLSPMSYNSYSPERRIPTANHITNISSYVADVLPFEFNDANGDEDEYEDELEQLSLPFTDSTFTHSTNSYYNKRVYNTLCYLINCGNILLFFAFSLINNRKVNKMNPSNESFVFFAISPYPNCYDKRDEVWKLFSYSFVHADIMHLLANSLGIFISTTNLYKFQSVTLISLLYVVCVINGALSFYLTNPYDALLGASGGVYGLAGSNIANYIYNSDNMYSFEILFSYLFFILFGLVDICNFFMMYSDTIAYQVHWYCFLFGILFGFCIFQEKKKRKYKKYIRYIAIFMYCYLNSLMLYNYIFNFPSSHSFNYFKFIKEENCCYDFINLDKNSTFECNDSIESRFLY